MTSQPPASVASGFHPFRRLNGTTHKTLGLSMTRQHLTCQLRVPLTSDRSCAKIQSAHQWPGCPILTDTPLCPQNETLGQWRGVHSLHCLVPEVLTELLESLLFSVAASFSLEALAVSGVAACVLEVLLWEDLFSASVFTSASASC